FDALAAPSGGARPEGSVREQLVGLVRDADNRLVPFRVWLVGLLARMPEEEVTRDLLDLYTQRSIPGQLRQGIATALLARRNGAQFLTAALSEHYDYLEGRQAPPLQVLAPALVNMGARDAVPGLLAHLLDHETPLAVLPDVVTAISTLGEAGAVPQFQRWVQFYKADSTFRGETHVAALNAAVDAIFRHGDQGARTWLRQLSEDPSANSLVRSHVTELFQREAQDTASRATAQSADQQRAALETELTRLREAQAAVPQELPEATLDEVWNAHLDELRACAQGAVTRNPSLNQIRVVLTLRSEVPRGLLNGVPPAQSGGTGPSDPRHPTTPAEALTWVASQVEGLAAQRSRVRQTTYAPNDPALRTCMDAVLQPLEFPAYRGTRQEFRRILDTRAARATTEAETFSGLGVDPQGRELPWWLVSAPTLEVVNPPRAGTAPAAVTDAGVAPAAARDAGPARAPDAGLTGTAGRPWWEEQ
ncbi:MAG: hypothetical protein HY909_23640, partial [Deltaproteobacteria bacterium]|nr:hypothetical protein [Deltaproteobacteria bacterium]